MHDVKLTKNQNMVFDTLNAAQEPMSAYRILDALRDQGFRAPLQVYRALDRLVELTLVHRLESLNAFVACRHEGCVTGKAMVFAICDNCGQVNEFEDEKISRHVQSWAKDDGFKLNKTTIELHGQCHNCA